MFSRAIVCPPSPNFADGITAAGLGIPDHKKALRQHAAYCEALARCGLTLIRLEPDPAFPDSTFVEDTAVLTEEHAVVTQPGADSRRGEVSRIREALSECYEKLDLIQPPGRIDGGDVCMVEDRFLIGLSDRTNKDGASQLAAFLAASGFESDFLDIKSIPGILHLKSGISYLGENRLLVIEALRETKSLEGFEIVGVSRDEEYAANCVRVNDHVLIPAGHPGVHRSLKALGYQVIELEMSEFQKMDGGLSCLSLRF